MNIHHILVPIDYSTCSMVVAEQAAGLASRLGARVSLLHVSEVPGGVKNATVRDADGVERAAAEVLVRDAQKRLGPFLAAVRGAGVSANGMVRLGPVVDTILAVTEEAGADLVILGTHGRVGLARMVLGSVAEAVARGVHVPVMLVRREVRPECARTDCNWCTAEGRSPAEDRIVAESDG